MTVGDGQAALDAVIELYEQATELRDRGDDAGAMMLVERALGGVEDEVGADIALVRARLAITRADLATRTRSVAEAIAIAHDAVERARRVRRVEPLVEPSALYMLGKAERPSAEHKHGATSFERSFELWRKVAGDSSRYAADAAASLAVAYLKLAEWQRAANALAFVFEHDPDGPQLGHVLQHAIASERLGELDRAEADLEAWQVAATDRPAGERLRGHLCAARVFAGRGDRLGTTRTYPARERALAELASARALAADDGHRAALLECSAWLCATIVEPIWPLAAEVMIRRAAALAWTPAIADTAWRIAARWRYGVEEPLTQPTFALIEVEACLERWDDAVWTYLPRPGHQQMQLVVVAAPTTIERLADTQWRELCVQRVFSGFHAELFKAHEPSFVAPVESVARRLDPRHVLSLLPRLRVPKWATANTMALTSLGEVEVLAHADIAALAVRTLALADDAAVAALREAVPVLDPEAARDLTRSDPDDTIAPAASVPLIPGS